MKKFLTTIVVALTLLMGAQTAKAQLSFGVTGGLNLSKLSYNDLPASLASDNRCGWYIGPKVEFKVPLIGLGVDAAVEYSQRRLNGELEAAGTDVVSSSTYLKTVAIPINLRYSIGLASLASLYVATGPQFGFNVGDKTWNWTNLNENVSGFEFKKSNVTWNVGAGVKLLKHLEVGVGYNIALSKFAKKYAGDGTFKSNTWQFQVAYMF